MNCSMRLYSICNSTPKCNQPDKVVFVNPCTETVKNTAPSQCFTAPSTYTYTNAPPAPRCFLRDFPKNYPPPPDYDAKYSKNYDPILQVYGPPYTF